MEKQQLLKKEEIYPSDEVLKEALKRTFALYESFIHVITGEEYSLNIAWRFYNDGKAWLGKVTYKKKTILWVSIWEGFFKTSFHFANKHHEAVTALDISANTLNQFAETERTGRLVSLIIDVKNEKQLEEVLSVVRFKKQLK